MATRFYLRLPDPKRARGDDPDFAFRSDGAEGLAEELEQALRQPALFERWRARQEDPDAIDPGLGASDPAVLPAPRCTSRRRYEASLGTGPP